MQRCAYGDPSGRVVLVFQPRKPQPCLAVSTALVAPRSWKDATHELKLRSVGLKEETCDELHPPLGRVKGNIKQMSQHMLKYY